MLALSLSLNYIEPKIRVDNPLFLNICYKASIVDSINAILCPDAVRSKYFCYFCIKWANQLSQLLNNPVSTNFYG